MTEGDPEQDLERKPSKKTHKRCNQSLCSIGEEVETRSQVAKSALRVFNKKQNRKHQMSTKSKTSINHKTGNAVTTKVTRSGNSTHIERSLKKSDGLFGTRFLGTEKKLTDKTIRRS